MRTIEKLDPTKPDDFTIESATEIFDAEFISNLPDGANYSLEDIKLLTDTAIKVGYKFGKINELKIRQESNAKKL